MIYIFHGDDLTKSRQAFNKQLDSFPGSEILKLDSKTIDLDQINNFLNGASLFFSQKTLGISNFFSISKPILDKLVKIINNAIPENNIILWQDKGLNATQSKTFPKAKTENFRLNNKLFACLNSIKPKNINSFISLFHDTIENGLYDLFLYMLKNQLRKQLATSSVFDKNLLKKTYLQLIELDYQNKTGQLSIPKELALERTIINLIK